MKRLFLARVLVGAMTLTAVVMSWVCHAGSSAHPLLVLLIYTPLPLLLVPAGLALLASLWLSWLWRFMAGVSLLLVLTVVMGFVWGRPDQGEEPVRFMTYNAKTYLASHKAGGLEALAAEVAAHDADVIVMQDAGELGFIRGAQRAALFQTMFGQRSLYLHAQYVVASRFPLRDCRVGQLSARQDGLNYVHCQVVVGHDAFDLVTVHLVTPRQGLNAFRYEGLEGLGAWHNNVADRTAQALELAEQVRGIHHPLVLAGDLNAPERSEILRILKGQIGLRDAFSSAGFGYGYTHGHSLRLGFSFLRIDHILVSDDIGVAKVTVGGKEGSEHRPVIADLLLHRQR